LDLAVSRQDAADRSDIPVGEAGVDQGARLRAKKAS
jgi:hypothetical protein